MQFLASFVRLISGLNQVVGKTFAWLSLAMVLVCFAVVVERYLFSSSTLWMQDLYVWMNGFMFTAVAGWALMRDDHVRVDIFYSKAPLKRKALIDLIGVFVFLLPFCWVVYTYSYNYILRSWRLYEASPNIGGMPGFFLLKTFIFVFVAVVALQGLAMAARSILVLNGREDLLPAQLRYKTAQE